MTPKCCRCPAPRTDAGSPSFQLEYRVQGTLLDLRVESRMAVNRYAAQFVPADIEAALSGRYIVGPEIAVGGCGQGAVFRATRIAWPDGTAADDVVALKLNLYGSQDIRVQREISALENVSHPNLPRLIEHGYCDVAERHTLYVAWELIDGQPLSVQMRHGPLLESETLRIGRDVAEAITEIWSRGIFMGTSSPRTSCLETAAAT